MPRKSTKATPETTAPASVTTAEPTPVEAPKVLTGRLTTDPVLRHTKTSGKPVTTIRIAVNGEPETEPQFHNVVVWGRTAEVVCQYLKKGRLVEVHGREQERTWTDADGAERRTAEVSAFRVQFIANRPTAPVAAEELS
jgi:single-strand DNA-binding protein